jgi:hypothetical protein
MLPNRGKFLNRDRPDCLLTGPEGAVARGAKRSHRHSNLSAPERDLKLNPSAWKVIPVSR